MADGEHEVGALEQGRIGIAAGDPGGEQAVHPGRERRVERLDEALPAPLGLGEQYRHLHRLRRGHAEAGQPREQGNHHCHAQAVGDEARHARAHALLHHPMRTPR